jgi:hypothetical protein
MRFPTVTVDINYLTVVLSNKMVAVSARIATMLIEVTLIISEFFPEQSRFKTWADPTVSDGYYPSIVAQTDGPPVQVEVI